MRFRVPLRLLRALLPAILLALAIRSFVAVPRSVPTESMMPTLLPGDLFLALRWPYGSPLAARFGGRMPRRGEIVVIGTPAGDVVKRVIGLPGDRVALRNGAVILNDAALPRFRVADYLVRETTASPCPAAAGTQREAQPGHSIRCRIRRYREMLPDGRDWDTLDRGATIGDDMPPRRVPTGRLFLLGDNRDRSADSRFAIADGGLGFVPVAALRGAARIIVWSHEDDARLAAPASWWRATRRDRIGRSLIQR